MKTVRLIIGSFTILIFGIGIIVAVVNGIISNDIKISAESISGSGAMVLAFNVLLTFAGILGIASWRKGSGSIATGALYILAALLGALAMIIYKEVFVWAIPLYVWAVVAAVFGFIFILGYTKGRGSQRIPKIGQ